MNYNQGKKNYHLVIFSVILFFYMFHMQISYKLNSGQEMELDGSSPAFQRIVVTALGCSCPVLSCPRGVYVRPDRPINTILGTINTILLWTVVLVFCVGKD